MYMYMFPCIYRSECHLSRWDCRGHVSDAEEVEEDGNEWVERSSPLSLVVNVQWFVGHARTMMCWVMKVMIPQWLRGFEKDERHSLCHHWNSKSRVKYRSHVLKHGKYERNGHLILCHVPKPGFHGGNLLIEQRSHPTHTHTHHIFPVQTKPNTGAFDQNLGGADKRQRTWNACTHACANDSVGACSLPLSLYTGPVYMYAHIWFAAFNAHVCVVYRYIAIYTESLSLALL